MTNLSFTSPPDVGAEFPGDGGRTQYGALCWRRIGDRLQVLLITSRETGRWVIPKGWPIAGLSPEASATREAYEEAGVEGQASARCVGFYTYDKGLGKPQAPRPTVPCIVAVYPLKVTALQDRYPECRERRRKWFSPQKAARKVAEPELQALLDGLKVHLLVSASAPAPADAAAGKGAQA
ncbi:MAG TPA: NUDIX hydrolase [Paracoccaceae bacterium]